MPDRHPHLLTAFALYITLATSPPTLAGMFTGFESDNNNTRLVFIGGQTSDDVFLHVFAADLKYEFLDTGVLTNVSNKMLNVAAGFRLGSNDNYSLLLGSTYNDKQEHTPTADTSKQDVGFFYQLGANARFDIHHYEFLASYASLDRFIWSRGRYKAQINKLFSAGAELFWMGNDDGDSWGSGILLEHAARYANIGIKAGYKRSTNKESGSYYGVEAYFPF